MKEKPNLSNNPKNFIEAYPEKLSKTERLEAQQPDQVSSDDTEEGKSV